MGKRVGSCVWLRQSLARVEEWKLRGSCQEAARKLRGTYLEEDGEKEVDNKETAGDDNHLRGQEEVRT